MQYFMQNKSETGREVLQCVAILGGTLFYAAGMNLFVVPAGLYTGGIMGLAQLLRTLLIHLTGWTPKIDIAGLLNYAINLPVLLIAWRRLDHTVVLKTLLAVTGITVFLMIIPRTDILSGDQLARWPDRRDSLRRQHRHYSLDGRHERRHGRDRHDVD